MDGNAAGNPSVEARLRRAAAIRLRRLPAAAGHGSPGAHPPTSGKITKS